MSDEPIVSHRNAIESIDDSVDWVKASGRRMGIDSAALEQLAPVIRRAFDNFLFCVGMSFEKAAARGIAQAVELIRDPQYYEKKKLRRKRSRAKNAERAAEEQRLRLIREPTLPTEDEIEKERNRLQRDAWYHSRELARVQKRLSEIGLPPNALNARLKDGKVQ